MDTTGWSISFASLRQATSQLFNHPVHLSSFLCRALALGRHVGLLSEGLAQLLLLLLGKVGRDDLEVVLLELLDHPVLRRPAGQHKQGRRPRGYLLTHRVDEVIVDADVGQGTAERSHSRAQGQPKQRYKED